MAKSKILSDKIFLDNKKYLMVTCKPIDFLESETGEDKTWAFSWTYENYKLIIEEFK